ncbi:hypothetical protein D9O50_12220 [Oxalobacteraceae bacterium CAVE-383]|nr:hypothetical protein D9O50_12220 [Oxalobacteraceae bacterium CAVE-383]
MTTEHRVNEFSYTAGKIVSIAALAGMALTAAAPASAVAPSTFGNVIGRGLLCMSQLDASYFYNYLTTSFGPPYKHEGNAYWFKTPAASLWDTPVSEVLISDKDSAEHFVAAVADVTPDVLAGNISDAVKIGFKATSLNPNPVRMSQAASTIIYYGKKSKIFCAKAKVLQPD